MEQLKYIIEDRTIAELLGAQNFTNQESAILELVKNAFDANATELDIIFKNNKLTIKDNGNGMNADDIKLHWMHVGKSNKQYDVIDRENKKRVLAGSKGIGRFALSRLGGSVELYSQRYNSNDNSVFWTTDWDRSLLQEKQPLNNHGTKIIIQGLRDKWNKTSINKLRRYLSRTYNNNLMKIKILHDDDLVEVNEYFVEPRLGYNCTSIIKLKYKAETRVLELVIDTDEFLSSASEYCKDISINTFSNNIDIFQELNNKKEINLSEEELYEVLTCLGNFDAEIYFSIQESLSKDLEKFLYKYKVLPSRYESGIILYRNSFSISSYDGTKDWIGFGKRARLSPAAATHPTGSWRVRENQVSGKVVIDKNENRLLEDLSNRQGLNENIYYEIFVKILDIGIASFERYRQSIIRKINIKNTLDKSTQKKVVDKIIRNPNAIKSLTSDETSKLVSEIKEYRKENRDFKKEIHYTEERYKYDIRILNVLATSGLKATSIAHEMQNDRNSIDDNCDKIVNAMKDFEIWDYVNEKERTKYVYSNIPELINKNKKVNAKIVSFMDTMLSEVEKSQFFAEEHNIYELLNDIKVVWERDYSWIDITLNLPEDLIYFLSEDVLKVIFDNLILNSVQQNDDKSHLEIYISVIYGRDFLEIIYKDNGKGLDEKYLDNTMKILEVHETARNNGHGLGMWIVNNTIIMYKGEIKKIEGNNGFCIEFTIGGK